MDSLVLSPLHSLSSGTQIKFINAKFWGALVMVLFQYINKWNIS